MAAKQGEQGELRLDIQGARGLGVLLVVVGHLFLWPAGVFAALDIFFVLSGFLITGILVPSIERYGAKFFGAFYLSRARRLVPMAVLVLLFTVAATYVVYSEARAKLVGIDAIWAFFFAVNWHFIEQGNDYFALHTASPLQHYWSLSVEEQFYLGWPLLILLALIAAARLKGRASRRSVVAVVLTGVTVISFGYSLWHSAAHPDAAYFSTFDRAWEFGAGGLLALWADKLTQIPRRWKMVLSWVGILGVLTTIFTLETGLPFPAPWGLLPVLLTGGIIVGGMNADTRHNLILHNPVMIYVGTISYSVYLWHMPVQVMLAPVLGLDTLPYYIGSLVTTMTLSVASYHLVERPLRRSRILMLPAERRRRPPSPVLEPWVAVWLKKWGGVAALCGMMATLYAGITVVRERGVEATPLGVGLAAQREQIAQALDATDFPPFVPTLDDLGARTWEQEHAKTACVNDTLPVFTDCRWGGGDVADAPVVAVVGDSFAIAWMPTIQEAFEAKGWVVQQLTMTQCSSWTMSSYVERNGTPYPACSTLHDQIVDYVRSEQPDMVILASSFDQVLNVERPDLGADDPVELAETALGATLDNLENGVTRFAVLQPPPPHRSLLDCVSRFGRPTACNSSPSGFWYDHVEGEQAATVAHGATYVETVDWFCVDYRCPAWVGSTPVTWDGAHLTVEYARALGPVLAQALFPDDPVESEVAEASG